MVTEPGKNANTLRDCRGLLDKEFEMILLRQDIYSFHIPGGGKHYRNKWLEDYTEKAVYCSLHLFNRLH